MNVDFAITGRHVYEIKAVLQSVGINNATETTHPKTRSSGYHTFAFRNKQAALEATTTWNATSSNPLIRIMKPTAVWTQSR